MAFHHTVLYKGNGMTYGGLHEKKEGAVAAKQELVNNAKCSAWGDIFYGFSRRQANALAGEWDKNTEVVELLEGEEYTPWGEGCTYIHGFNDGTHVR